MKFLCRVQPHLGDSGTKNATMQSRNKAMAHMPWKLYHSSAKNASRPTAIAPEEENTCGSWTITSKYAFAIWMVA